MPAGSFAEIRARCLGLRPRQSVLRRSESSTASSRHWTASANSELGFAKIDWRPTDSDSFSFSMNYLRWISPNGIQTQAVLTNGNGIGNNANSTVRTRYGRAQWTRVVSSNAVNEARFGWFKDRLFDEVNPELIPPVTGRLGLTVADQANLGTAIDYPRLNPSEQRFQFVDTMNWNVGRHGLKFGVGHHQHAGLRQYPAEIRTARIPTTI